MQHVLAGQKNKQIAHAMSIKEKTVKVHRARMMGKVGALNIVHLVRMAQSVGL
jgi:FixJ family two-component response regulator